MTRTICLQRCKDPLDLFLSSWLKIRPSDLVDFGQAISLATCARTQADRLDGNLVGSSFFWRPLASLACLSSFCGKSRKSHFFHSTETWGPARKALFLREVCDVCKARMEFAGHFGHASLHMSTWALAAKPLLVDDTGDYTGRFSSSMNWESLLANQSNGMPSRVLNSAQIGSDFNLHGERTPDALVQCLCLYVWWRPDPRSGLAKLPWFV